MTNTKEVVYLIGSLRLPAVRGLAAELRAEGFDVFDDWHAAGEKALEIGRIETRSDGEAQTIVV